MGVGGATDCGCASASVSCRSPSGCACCCNCNDKREHEKSTPLETGSPAGGALTACEGSATWSATWSDSCSCCSCRASRPSSTWKIQEREQQAAVHASAGGGVPGALPVVWTLADLGAAVWLLLDCFGGGGVGGLLLHLDHVWGAGFGGGGEAADGQRGGPVRVEAFGLQLGLRQEHLPPLHLLLQLLIVGLQARRSHRLERSVQADGAGLRGDSNLLPAVEPQRGDADLLDLLLRGSEQQVPVGPGWKRDLQRREAA